MGGVLIIRTGKVIRINLVKYIFNVAIFWLVEADVDLPLQDETDIMG